MWSEVCWVPIKELDFRFWILWLSPRVGGHPPRILKPVCGPRSFSSGGRETCVSVIITLTIPTWSCVQWAGCCYVFMRPCLLDVPENDLIFSSLTPSGHVFLRRRKDDLVFMRTKLPSDWLDTVWVLERKLYFWQKKNKSKPDAELSITRSLVLSCSDCYDRVGLPPAVSMGYVTHNRASYMQRLSLTRESLDLRRCRCLPTYLPRVTIVAAITSGITVQIDMHGSDCSRFYFALFRVVCAVQMAATIRWN